MSSMKKSETSYFLRKVFFYLSIACIFVACAQKKQLTGGDNDDTAPKIQTEKSTKNEQTNFTKQDIKITFDEWVAVKDVLNQVIVTPPLEYQPKIKLKKKTVIFQFDEKEVLRPNATYTINFGEAVKDLTVGNVAEDLRYVFSTGDFLDSLKVSGQVVDALTNEPVKEALVMLYDNLADSVVRTEKPLYFSKTDEQGNFKIENIRADTFKVFALIDADRNYLFNLPTEAYGFLDSTIIINDTVNQNIKIKFFTPNPKLKVTERKDKQFGLYTIAFNQEPTDLYVDWQNVGQQVEYLIEEDTLKVWYFTEQDTSWNIYLSTPNDFTDTLLVKKLDRTEFLEQTMLKVSSTLSSQPIDKNPTKSIKLSFNHPIKDINVDNIYFYEDSTLQLVPAEIKFMDEEPQTIEFNYKFKEDVLYTLEFLDSAFIDIYGNFNKDTVVQEYRVLPLKNFGNYILTIKSLKPGIDYKMKLLFNKENLVEELSFRADSVYNITFNTLPPGTYSLEIIEDENNNGKWDMGNYETKKQAETIHSIPLEELQAFWDKDITIDLEDIKKPTIAPEETPESLLKKEKSEDRNED